jgi:hypothetical protein
MSQRVYNAARNEWDICTIWKAEARDLAMETEHFEAHLSGELEVLRGTTPNYGPDFEHDLSMGGWNSDEEEDDDEVVVGQDGNEEDDAKEETGGARKDTRRLKKRSSTPEDAEEIGMELDSNPVDNTDFHWGNDVFLDPPTATSPPLLDEIEFTSAWGLLESYFGFEYSRYQHRIAAARQGKGQKLFGQSKQDMVDDEDDIIERVRWRVIDLFTSDVLDVQTENDVTPIETYPSQPWRVTHLRTVVPSDGWRKLTAADNVSRTLYKVTTSNSTLDEFDIIVDSCASLHFILSRITPPDVNDTPFCLVASEALQRFGMRFWTSKRSIGSAVRPFEDVYPVGVGYRPMGWEPTATDYALWLRRVEDLLKTPRGRAAAMRSGLVWRLSVLLGLRMQDVKDTEDEMEFLFDASGPSSEATALQLQGGEVLVDDHLSLDDLEIICGGFTVFACELFHWLRWLSLS